jgi:hypothetical protein
MIRPLAPPSRTMLSGSSSTQPPKRFEWPQVHGTGNENRGEIPTTAGVLSDAAIRPCTETQIKGVASAYVPRSGHSCSPMGKSQCQAPSHKRQRFRTRCLQPSRDGRFRFADIGEHERSNRFHRESRVQRSQECALSRAIELRRATWLEKNVAAARQDRLDHAEIGTNAYLFDPGVDAVCSSIDPMRRLASGWKELAAAARSAESVAGLLDTRPFVASITVVSPVVSPPSARS